MAIKKDESVFWGLKLLVFIPNGHRAFSNQHHEVVIVVVPFHAIVVVTVE
jgi:hypothetical protein